MYGPHFLGLTGVGNARELGGTVVGGRRIKPGLLLRTASLAQAAAEDLDRLAQVYHVSDVVDFRMTMERKITPDPVLPGAKNHFCPVMDPQDFSNFDPQFMEAYLDPNGDRLKLLQTVVRTGMLNQDLYQHFLLLPQGQAAYRAFFQVLLALPEGRAALWHCTDGKDRTGVASALLLTALGASRETVMEDYLLTNQANQPRLDALREKLARSPLSPKEIDLALFLSGGVSPAYLNSGMNALTERYGSVEGYLAQELSVGKQELTELRRKFLA